VKPKWFGLLLIVAIFVTAKLPAIGAAPADLLPFYNPTHSHSANASLFVEMRLPF
jgi:hypothetical protein